MRILSYFLILLFGLLTTFGACTKSNHTKSTDGYHFLNQSVPRSSVIDKKVQFTGRIARMVMQHMMAGSPMGNDEHWTIDPTKDSGLGQIMVYAKKGTVKYSRSELRNKFLLIRGTMHKMTGAGKGGGIHTEYYVKLDSMQIIDRN